MKYFQQIALSILLSTYCFSMETCWIKDYKDTQLQHQKCLAPGQVEELIKTKLAGKTFNITKIQCYAKGGLPAKVWLARHETLPSVYSKNLSPSALTTIIIVPDHATFKELTDMLKDIK